MDAQIHRMNRILNEAILNFLTHLNFLIHKLCIQLIVQYIKFIHRKKKTISNVKMKHSIEEAKFSNSSLRQCQFAVEKELLPLYKLTNFDRKYSATTLLYSIHSLIYWSRFWKAIYLCNVFNAEFHISALTLTDLFHHEI